MIGSPRLLTPGNLIAAVAILAAVALVLLRGHLPGEEAEPEDDRASLVLLELEAKLLTGVARFDRERALTELDQLENFNDSAAGRRAVTAIHAYVQAPASREQALLHLPPAESRDPLDELVARSVSSPASLSPDEQETLRSQMGWFGRLLLASGNEQDAQTVASDSLQTMTLASLGSLLLILALGLGLFLLPLGLLRHVQGLLPFRFQPSQERAHLYFQSFAVYLWGMILLGSLLPGAGLAASTGAIAVSLALGIAYPLLRGVKLATWCADSGWNRGAGFFREAAAGLAAYIAMLPVLAIGLAATFFLQRWGASAAGEPPSPISHPIYGMIPSASPATIALLFLVAAVLGPIAEEIMFRGALYGWLRSFAGRILSLLIMSFVFAAVHPQGLFAIPSLMAVAISFGLMREWRSSLVAGAVMHGLHNGTLLLAILTLLS